MSRTPFSPAPLPVGADAPLHLGFTAWVELTRPGIAEVLAFSRGLDRYLASLGLVRSMNPLHLLVWSPERSLSADDQADLIEWMASERRVAVVSIGQLRPHAGIPSVRGREKALTARPTDPEWLGLFRTYRSLPRDAQQAIALIRQAASMPGSAEEVAMRSFRSHAARGAPAAVYLIHRTDRRRFKVGWAFDPPARAQGLPECRGDLLDLNSSLALWLASRQRAEQVERAMHKCLAPYGVPSGHRGDGHSEWFAPAALPTAIQLLRQMPGEAGTAESALRPLMPELPEVIFAAAEQPPQDVWFDVEDLWLRMAALLPARADCVGGCWQVRFSEFRRACDGDMAELRMRALDVDTFSWNLAGERGAFVRLIAYEGDDLVFTVTSIPTMVRWPQGDDLGWQVKGFLARLRALQLDQVEVPSF